MVVYVRKLSDQVHLNDAHPDAALGIGTYKSISATDLQSAANSGELENPIDWKSVRPGDWFHQTLVTLPSLPNRRQTLR